MRGSIGIGRKLPNPINISNAAAKHTIIPFSTSSGGRGRGRGGSPPTGGPIRFGVDSAPRAPGQPESDDSQPDPFGSAIGHGRGKPMVPSSPVPPSFASSIKPPTAAGRGRVPSPHSDEVQHSELPKRPIFFKRESGPESARPPPPPQSTARQVRISDGGGESNLPESIRSLLSGAGRGKPIEQPVPEAQTSQENRHLRAAKKVEAPGRRGTGQSRMSLEEAVKHARGILSRGGYGEGEGEELGGGGGRGRGFRGRGGRGRGRGRGDWRERERGQRGQLGDSEDGYGAGLYLGDNADGEKLANRLGTETMNKLVEGFEELSHNVLPSPLEDAYLDALHTNFMIEFEPEYLMGDFDRNPDIDEKPPMSLGEALEKVKPFLMVYEGIQSQEEWEEIIKETMETVPLLKEIVDYYSGPDTVTAKQQQQELERVAKTLPASAPDSVKQFTERAVQSLQSNPGWGFDKKCQYMDKLVWKVSQLYK
ncbi:hypothetical protein FEM48_Zijuj03G0008300 [Ziziphus jujuba var. spinosa]|uniref:Uncharacterized protein n=1 Tax=Ziziphus jujuba var. spinosa TaxID=714518 RepID=A0A978VM87_ZIZJJ|nr:hypothetical protein FEM48_Zijuj03G0008300 [Ziziphus jujuba var. spinosa]